MAERLTGQISGSNLHAAVKEALTRYKNFLIDKKVIKSTDVQKILGGPKDVKRMNVVDTGILNRVRINKKIGAAICKK